MSDVHNPKDVAGSTRLDLSLVCPVGIAEEALAMTEGWRKYGRANFVGIKVKGMVYAGAALRHLFKWICGEDIDPKTGVHHLGSVRACCGILLECAARGRLIDDRPPRWSGFSQFLDSFESRVRFMYGVYKDLPMPKHWTIADDVEKKD